MIKIIQPMTYQPILIDYVNVTIINRWNWPWSKKNTNHIFNQQPFNMETIGHKIMVNPKYSTISFSRSGDVPSNIGVWLVVINHAKKCQWIKQPSLNTREKDTCLKRPTSNCLVLVVGYYPLLLTTLVPYNWHGSPTASPWELHPGSASAPHPSH